jgi:putative OPT family oligopeptide transporter
MEPFIPPEEEKPVDPRAEFTLRAIVTGTALGLVFGASSLYLVLKVGLTVSASIPVAVLAITLFRLLDSGRIARRTGILENNIIQTAGSAGESIAFGVGVTMPGLMLIGFDLDLARVMTVSLLGGVLGILMMIPLRKLFIVKMHGAAGQPGTLLYPEGTACAKVLESGEKGGAQGGAVFAGFTVAIIHKFATEAMGLLKAGAELPLHQFSRVARVSGDLATELLGVGYIIGLRVSALMLAGSVLGGLVIVPAVAFFGDGRPDVLAPATKPIGILQAGDIEKTYLRFLGAGCVAAAGVFSMLKTLPLIIGAALSTFRGKKTAETTESTDPRQRDLPPLFVWGGLVALLGGLTAFLAPEVGVWAALVGALLVLVFGFLFVTVSSRLTGEIGSSSNPISGMTIATLLLTCLIFLSLGMVGPRDALLALSIGGIVCIAASNGGTTSQDLKTGYLVGGTPWLQQWAIIIGALTSALVIGGTLLLFNSAGVVHSTRNLPEADLSAYAGEMTSTETHEGKVYKAWRPTPEAVKAVPGLKRARYLVDESFRARFLVDPSITGEFDSRDVWVAESRTVPGLADLSAGLPTTAQVDGKTFKIVRALDPEQAAKTTAADPTGLTAKLNTALAAVPPGEYLVDPATGGIAYRNDPQPVKMKFPAPKTQVMGIIINGLLNQDLNWTLILLGAMVSVALELCGVSSLAFAVGVYVPMAATTPIFVGGLARWLADWFARDNSLNHDDPEAIAKSESAPGVLLASGYIAGGSLGGVLIAFLEFAPPLKKSLELGRLVDPLGGWLEILSLALFAMLMAALVLVNRKPAVRS